MQPKELGKVYHIGVDASRRGSIATLQTWVYANILRSEAYRHDTGAGADQQGSLDVYGFFDKRSVHLLTILTRNDPQERPAYELIFDGMVDKRLQTAGFVRATTGSRGEERREFI